MPFQDLADQPLVEYLNAHRDDEAFWFFLHIPKTAGSSFSKELSERTLPYANIHVDYEDTETPFNERLEASVKNFIQRHNKEPFRSASGHLPIGLYRQIREATQRARTITFLRDPVKRVVSDFRYQRTPMHPPYQEFTARFPTLGDYVASPESQNKMAEFFGWTAADGPEELASVLNEFTFVGLVEMYPMSFSCIFNLMGFPDQLPTVHTRKTPATAATDVDLNPEMIQAIRDANQSDFQLYEAVRTILIPKRDEWRAAPT